MKRSLSLALALSATFPAVAHAEWGAQDNVPAATLLFPYAEADLDAANGKDTILGISNREPNATLTNVVVWSEAGVPVLRFNVYLTGYDVEVFRLRDVLTGTLPATATDGQDQADTISPQGDQSQDINFATCNGVLPYAALDATEVARVQAALTGSPLPGQTGRCAAPARGDRVARGYVTVDVVNSCDPRFPGEDGYFLPNGGGVAARQNRLLGEFFLVDGTQTAGAPAVHLEAGVANNTYLPTFYGRLVGHSGLDGREPLAGNYAIPYVTGRAELLVWRDPKVAVTDFACDEGPGYGTLPLEALWVFDRQEEVLDFSQRPLFPHVVTRTVVGEAALPVVAREGWMHLSLHHRGDPTELAPAMDPDAAQGVVLVLTHPERQGAVRPFLSLQRAAATDDALRPAHLGSYP
ncbi:MAG: hypothetical protein AB2A00_01850 [Myxococcota bacterium]